MKKTIKMKILDIYLNFHFFSFFHELFSFTVCFRKALRTPFVIVENQTLVYHYLSVHIHTHTQESFILFRFVLDLKTKIIFEKVLSKIILRGGNSILSRW